jgi:hypothetical protein
MTTFYSRLAQSLLCLVFGLGTAALPAAPHANSAPAKLASADDATLVYLEELHLDTHSGAVYVAGARFCKNYTEPEDDQSASAYPPYCPYVLERSTDGGASWADLGRSLNARLIGEPTDIYWTHSVPTEQLVTANDGTSLYVDTMTLSADPNAGGFQSYETSTDGGLSWHDLAIGEGESPYSGWPAANLAVSPADPARLYALLQPGDGDDDPTPSLATSGDRGNTWTIGPDLKVVDYAENSGTANFAVVPDSKRARTVYVQVPGDSAAIYRSDDAGATWNTMALPSGQTADQLALSTDPQVPGLLLASSDTTTYYSTDEGKTWQSGTCPGMLGGQCPNLTVANAFGTGANYAFFPSGIYRFQGQKPAGARLAINPPFALDSVVAVACRGKPGDPVYVLTKETRGDVDGVLYRSTDAGNHWESLLPRLLPNLTPASTAPGSLYVAATGHSVAAPFAGEYQKLGLQLIGYPVTEAYMEANVLTQDFEHLRLELVGGTVAIGDMTDDVLFARASEDQDLFYAAIPIDQQDSSSPPKGKYVLVAQTQHYVQGNLLPFWQAHKDLLGPPLTEQFASRNGDGSGRTYTMQYFRNGRLEFHPENKNPAYRVELGLLGRDIWGFDRPST